MEVMAPLLFKTRFPNEKVSRDAFLYLPPKPPLDQFAQCSTCFMWTGSQRQRCTIHGPAVPVTGDMSCGFYIHGEPMLEMARKEVTRVRPEESGLVKRAVRCEDCRFFHATVSRCHLFDRLNRVLPDVFDLDPAVHPQGCCNAQTP